MGETADSVRMGWPSAERYTPRILRWLLRTGDSLYRAPWVVTRNRFEAKEFTQEAVVRLLERWDRVSVMDDPRAYLFRTAMRIDLTEPGYGRRWAFTVTVLPNRHHAEPWRVGRYPCGPHASLGVTRIRGELAPAGAGWVVEVSGYPDAVRRDIVAGST